MGNCNENRSKTLKPEVLESVLKYVNTNQNTYPICSLMNKYKNYILKSKSFFFKTLNDSFTFINFQMNNNAVKTIRLNKMLKDTKLFEEEIPVHKMIFGDLSCSFKPNLSNMEPKNVFSLGKKTFLTIYSPVEKDNLYRNMTNQNPIIIEEEFVTIYSERSKQYKIVKLDPTALLEVSLPRNQVHINNNSNKINKIKSNLNKFQFKTITKIKYIFCRRANRVLYLSLHENNCIYAWVFSEESNKQVTLKLISNITHAMLSGFFLNNEDDVIDEKINDFDICYDINSHLDFHVLNNKEVEIIDMRSRGLCYDTEVFMVSTYPQHAVAFFIVNNDRITFHKILNLSIKLENPNLVIEEENSVINDLNNLNNLFLGPVSIYNTVDKEYISLYYSGNKIVKFEFKFTSKLSDDEVMEFDVEYKQTLLELPMLANATIIMISQINFSNISILYSPEELRCKMLLILNVKLAVVNNLELVYDEYYEEEFGKSLEKSKFVIDEDSKIELFKKYVEEVNEKEVFSNKNINNLSTFNKLKPFMKHICIPKGNYLLLFNLHKVNNISQNIKDYFVDDQLVNVCISSVSVLNLKDICKKIGYNQDYYDMTKREIVDPNDKEKITKINMIVKYKMQNVFPFKQILDKIQIKEVNMKMNQQRKEINENDKQNNSGLNYFLDRLSIGNN